MDSDAPGAWHALTAAVAIAALVLQLVLVVQGGRVLDDTSQPGLGIRLGRLVSYFTIQSNILVAVTAAQLARDPARDGPAWRTLRLAAVVGIAITGVVHFFLLRPLLDLDGADLAGRQAAAHGRAGARGRRLGGLRPASTDRPAATSCRPCAGRWPGSPGRWSSAGCPAGIPTPSSTTASPRARVASSVTSVGITLFFLLLFWLARLVDGRAKVAP